MSQQNYTKCHTWGWVLERSSCTSAYCNNMRAYQEELARRAVAAANVNPRPGIYQNASSSRVPGGAPAAVAGSSTNTGSNRAPRPQKQPKPLPEHLSHYYQGPNKLFYCPHANCRKQGGMKRDKLQKHHDWHGKQDLEQKAYAKLPGRGK